MHIAVCDDNIADRKQTERLLDRESAERINKSGNLFVDSFGNVNALLTAPMKYDLFFIDMTASSPNGMETAVKLRTIGVTSPIVLLISSIDYRAYPNPPESIFFLEKPIKKSSLSELLDRAVEICASKPETVELRDEKTVRYVLPDQILFSVLADHAVCVHLSDGTTVNQLGDISDIARILAPFDVFLIIAGKTIININHVTGIKNRTVTMSDGTVLKAGLTEGKNLLRIVSGRGSRFIP